MDKVVLEFDYAEASALECVLSDYIWLNKKLSTELQNNENADPEKRNNVIRLNRERAVQARKFLRAVELELNRVEVCDD